MARVVRRTPGGGMVEQRQEPSKGLDFLQRLLGEGGKLATGIAGAEMMEHYMGDEAPTSQHACLLRNQTDQNQSWTWDPVTQQCVPSPRVG